MKKEYYSRKIKIKEIEEKQLLKTHLKAVAKMASANASKIGLAGIGKLIGLLHDIGKYQNSFQQYLKYGGEKGSVHHAAVGAIYIYEKLKSIETADIKIYNFLAEVLALCITSHHTNLIDMLTLEGNNNFERRMGKKDDINFDEAIKNIDDEIKKELESIDIDKVSQEIKSIVDKISTTGESIPKHFYLGMLVKNLLSCLIDADHTDSANFELGINTDEAKAQFVSDENTQNKKYLFWKKISKKLKGHLSELNKTNKSNDGVKTIRKNIANDCLNAGKTFERGCYKLEVPTGGGKTLASFRFGVEMAKRYTLDRIIYCSPFTTIIEQNAEVIREIVETEKDDKGKIVLEHHSNLSQKNKTKEEIDLNELLTQNWDAPIIFTTNVRILETLFGGKTSDTRRLHQLANSIIIFDEIQTLPIKCVHIFNNAMNFLVDICGATVVLCTATQPLLNNISEEEKIKKRGEIKLSSKANIINIKNLFNDLKRVELFSCLDKVYTSNEIADKAIKLTEQNNNCLVVCNTTKSAKEIFGIIEKNESYRIYHLSARMTPIHRKWILRCIKRDLAVNKKITVVSTQVIEAGIDIDFNSAIRALAGLDSIFQTAGRVNRNGNIKDKSGKNTTGTLFVYEFTENVDLLNDINKAKESARIVLKQDINDNPLNAINNYYEDYFYQRTKEMQYLCSHGNSLLDLLSENKKYKTDEFPKLEQSFSVAAKEFKAIDNITQSVIIDNGKARKMMKKIKGTFNPVEKYRLIRELYKYSVNIFPKQQENFCKKEAIHKLSDDLDIFYLHSCYYDKNFGITEESTLDEGGIIV